MPKYILVIDDDPVTSELVKRTLQGQGYEVGTDHNGQDALEDLKKRKPDLILMDVQMPKMDGYTFILEKTKIPELADIPVIVLTSMKETAPLFKRHGVKAYLLKPLDSKDLLDKVQAILPN